MHTPFFIATLVIMQPDRTKCKPAATGAVVPGASASTWLSAAAAALLGAAAAPTAHAQEYPSKPVVIVVPAAAGGPTDTLAQPWRGDGKRAEAADDHRQLRWRRRHHRHQQGGEGAARRLHGAAVPHWHVDVACAVSQVAVRHGQRLRVHRPGGRRADGAGCEKGNVAKDLR